MNTLLSQALWLTLWGMGTTFAAIGVLVGGMYLLTVLFKDRPGEAEAEGEKEEPAAVSAGADQRVVAAVAAVATALAQAGSVLRLPAGETLAAGSWDSFARSRRLSGRAQHDQRRAVR